MRYVSIHAPTRGATGTCGNNSTITYMFQSTHPHGVRRYKLFWRPSAKRCFNPRTHTGCDLALGYGLDEIGEFQSTHPHGVRHHNLIYISQRLSVSIHAPTRGATTNANEYASGFRVSIHAPTRGATKRMRSKHADFHPVSIHAPTRGATPGT